MIIFIFTIHNDTRKSHLLCFVRTITILCFELPEWIIIFIWFFFFFWNDPFHCCNLHFNVVFINALIMYYHHHHIIVVFTIASIIIIFVIIIINTCIEWENNANHLFISCLNYYFISVCPKCYWRIVMKKKITRQLVNT